MRRPGRVSDDHIGRCEECGYLLNEAEVVTVAGKRVHSYCVPLARVVSIAELEMRSGSAGQDTRWEFSDELRRARRAQQEDDYQFSREALR